MTSLASLANDIIETLRQPLVVLDHELRVVAASRSFYRSFALEPAATLGRQLLAAGDGRLDVPALRGFLDLASSGGGIEDHEIEIALPGQPGRRTLRLSADSIEVDPRRAERKVLVVMDDITDRKRTEEALEAAKWQAERANLGKSRFLAAASHDLRQPLQTLSLLRGILAKTVVDKEEQEIIRKFDETIGTMSSILNTLLDINQLEAGIVRAETVDFPIGDLLTQLRTEVAYGAGASGLGWHVVQCGSTVRSDPRLLAQMVRNLLSNAVKYTKRGKILLGCRRRGGRLRIEVRDTGIGIPQEHLALIFEEFHQLDNPARESSRGLGLGLSIVQRLGNLLNHTVDVQSWVGKGSVFAIEVPLGAVAQVRPAQEAAAAPNGPSHGTILIIEDDPMVRESLQSLLVAENYRTIAVGDGNAALAIAHQGRVRLDLVLADYNLPGGMNGLEVVAGLRAILAKPFPVVFVTGDISRQTIDEIARHRCLQLSKPVRPEALIHLVRELLAPPPEPAAPTEIPPVAAQVDAAPAAEGPQEGRPVTVCVIDDDRGLREALRDLLRQHGRPVELYATGEEFLAAWRPERALCLIIDAKMPGMGGLALLELLKARGGGPPAIMITGHGDVRTAVRAMQAGAIGFIEKPVAPEDLVAAVARAAETVEDTTAHLARRAAAARAIAGLTVRQREIMKLVIEGHPNKQIAYLLGINQRTVESHRFAIMKRLAVKSLAELIHLEFAASGASHGPAASG